MELDLRFFATFREAVGQKDLTYEVTEGETVGDVLSSLEAEYEGLEGQLLDDGAVRSQLNVLKNGRNVIHMEDADTPLEEGDELAIFPPVAGG